MGYCIVNYTGTQSFIANYLFVGSKTSGPLWVNFILAMTGVLLVHELNLNGQKLANITTNDILLGCCIIF